MTPLRAASPRACDRPGCGAPILFATREDTRRVVPYDAEVIDGQSMQAAGCHVLVQTGRDWTAWNPRRLAEHFQVHFELPSIDHGRELVADYPHHKPHLHLEGAPA